MSRLSPRRESIAGLLMSDRASKVFASKANLSEQIQSPYSKASSRQHQKKIDCPDIKSFISVPDPQQGFEPISTESGMVCNTIP